MVTVICTARTRSVIGTVASPKRPTSKIAAKIASIDTMNVPAIANVGRHRADSQSRKGIAKADGLKESQDSTVCVSTYAAMIVRSARTPAASATSAPLRVLRSNCDIVIRSGATTTTPIASDKNHTNQASQNGPGECSKIIV